MGQEFPDVNGFESSWSDVGVTAQLPGAPDIELGELEAIKYSSKVDIGTLRGTSGGRVMKQTAGSETTDGSMTLPRGALFKFMEALEEAAVASGVPRLVRGNEVVISAVRFDILVQHTPIGDTRIYTGKMTGCRFLGLSFDLKQGNDADLVEVPLSPMRIAHKSASGRWIVLR